MRIGIDARPIQGRFTGDATYWSGLITGLSHAQTDDEILLYLDPKLQDPQLHLPSNFKLRFVSALSWRVWSFYNFPKALKADKVDVAHVQYTIPPLMPCPVVSTVHDVSFKRHPELFRLKDRMLLDLGVRKAVKQATHIIAVSEYTKSEVCALYDVPPGKVEVVYVSVREQFKPVDKEAAWSLVRENYGLETPFVLSVGVIQPRKNLPRLLEGFAGLKEMGHTGHKLVVVGKYGWKQAGLLTQIDQLGLKDDVILTGYVPTEDLPALYSAADVFVYPSIYEGFGSPVVEAMACGAPLICGNQTSLPEVAGNAGILVDPYNPKAFAEAMYKVLSSETMRDEMSVRGLAQVKKFSWDRSALRMLEIYHESAGI